MKTAVVVHPVFDEVWPFAADRLRELLEPIVDLTFVRLTDPGAGLQEADLDATTERILALGLTLDVGDLDNFPGLRELYQTEWTRPSSIDHSTLDQRGIRSLSHSSEGFWGQSVAEFALGLTIAALRRIAQTHHSIISSQDDWQYPLMQFGDDPRFTHGTVEGKRIRIVGAGNIASRYASFVSALGADVAAWDPFARDPAFHRTGARRERTLERLVDDAEIFAPMVPLTSSTEGLITAEHIRALPNGCLVVLVTRAGICDMAELRRGVLGDRLALAADVFDVEPLPLDDPLLGRHNVVHTPHRAGRTRESNLRWAEMLADEIAEYDGRTVALR